jgi:formylglycine-generating enzyme required for sulfatase activity
MSTAQRLVVSLSRPEWIPVPGGAFWMGGGSRKEENPRHRVSVEPFAMMRTVVTRRHYGVFLEASGRQAPPFWDELAFGHPEMPAVGPSWEDAEAFCRWAGELWQEEVRLPSEAEWECAAKAGRDVLYPWGDESPELLPDYHRRWREGPEPVDAYPTKHPLGLQGIGENVHEWCLDWFDASYYAVSPVHDPTGPARGRRRSARGGSWRHAIKVSRCAARSSIPPHFRYNDFGFRLVRSGG